MNTTISNQIIEVLNALCDKFGIAIDWTGQNVMPYVQELMRKAVNYELWTNITCVIVLAVITTVCWIVVYKLSRTSGFQWDDAFDEFIPTIAILLTIVGCVLIIIDIFIFFDAYETIVACLSFPEKIIFNMLQS